MARQIIWFYLVVGREHDHALDQIAQLSHVPRPRILGQPLHRVGGNAVELAVVLRRVVADETANEHGDVFGTLAQRREIDAQDVEAIKEIGAEASVVHQLADRLVRRGDDAHVHRNRRHAADAHELALLEHAQELDLRRRRNLADLVEKERSRISELEPPEPALGGAGKCALLVAEQLTLEQRLRERADVLGDERLGAPVGEHVDRAGDELLPRSALALDEHGARHRRHLLHLHHHLAHPVALADEPSDALETPPLENPFDPRDDLVDDYWFGEYFYKPNGAQPHDQFGIGRLGEADRRDAVPELLLHERDGERIGEFGGEDEDVRLLALDASNECRRAARPAPSPLLRARARR